MIVLDVLRGVALGVVLVALVALASACVDLPPGVGPREHPESEP